MKTAGREDPNRWATVPSTRVHGAAAQRSRSITWAGKQEKLRLREMCFFLTSPFIELLRHYPAPIDGAFKGFSPGWGLANGVVAGAPAPAGFFHGSRSALRTATLVRWSEVGLMVSCLGLFSNIRRSTRRNTCTTTAQVGFVCPRSRWAPIPNGFATRN